MLYPLLLPLQWQGMCCITGPNENRVEREGDQPVRPGSERSAAGCEQRLGGSVKRSAVDQADLARNGDVHIAYQVLGDGPIDLLFATSYVSHLEFMWENERIRYFNEQLA